LYIFVK